MAHFILGLVMIPVGVMAIAFSRQIARYNVSINKALFGVTLPEWWPLIGVVGVGVGLIVFGSVLLLSFFVPQT